MRDSFVQSLESLAEENSNIILITADLGFGIFNNFREKYPRQFLNVGIAEQNMIGIATGLALEGKIVYTYSIANFSTLRCLEQIRNDAAYHEANVNIVSSGGGMSYGVLGISHHATEDLAIMRTIPGMIVIAPGDAWEMREATKALANKKGSGFLRIDKTTAKSLNFPGESFQIGKVRELIKGEKIAIISTGGILKEVLDATKILNKEDINPAIFSMHTLKPIDKLMLTKIGSKYKIIVTVEEHSILGGLGSAVAEFLMEQGLVPQYFLRVGLKDQFSCIVGSQEYLRDIYSLDAKSIANRIKDLL